jgi:hypothetical protein
LKYLNVIVVAITTITNKEIWEKVVSVWENGVNAFEELFQKASPAAMTNSGFGCWRRAKAVRLRGHPELCIIESLHINYLIKKGLPTLARLKRSNDSVKVNKLGRPISSDTIG